MIYSFDLDGCLCSPSSGDYSKAKPYYQRIVKVNELYGQGHTIIIDTARGSNTGKDWDEVTKKQLEQWGVRYHKLIVGKKTFANRYIDDKATNADEFFESI